MVQDDGTLGRRTDVSGDDGERSVLAAAKTEARAILERATFEAASISKVLSVARREAEQLMAGAEDDRRRVLAEAHTEARSIVGRARADGPRADQEASRVVDRARQEADRLLVDARNDADGMRAQAKEQAGRTLGEARREARTLVAEATESGASILEGSRAEGWDIVQKASRRAEVIRSEATKLLARRMDAATGWSSTVVLGVGQNAERRDPAERDVLGSRARTSEQVFAAYREVEHLSDEMRRRAAPTNRSSVVVEELGLAPGSLPPDGMDMTTAPEGTGGGSFPGDEATESEGECVAPGSSAIAPSPTSGKHCEPLIGSRGDGLWPAR